MSELVHRAGVYWKMPMCNSMEFDKLIKFFEPLNCKIDYYDTEDEIVVYMDEINTFSPRCTDDGWIIQYILIDEVWEGDCEFAIDSFDMSRLTGDLVLKLKIKSESLIPIAYSYIWYNGVDEPFVDPLILDSDLKVM